MAAETVTLKDGRVIVGTCLGGSPSEVKLEVGDQIRTVNVVDVVRIEFSAASERRERETAAMTGSIELPAGTNLVIRIIDAVDSERNSVGQTIAASLHEKLYFTAWFGIRRSRC